MEGPRVPNGGTATSGGSVDFAAKATDLAALRDAVIDAANVSGGLWLSYLAVLLYLSIAVGGVTHKDLLYENPVKLPFLGVDLPLVGFFVLGPLLFVVVHAYTLLHFTLLADKVGAFHRELEAQIADDDTRSRLRRQLPSNIFVQFLSGPRDIRDGVLGMMLRLIALISLVLGPIGVLVFFVLQFLPFHNQPVSWWQRLMVLSDLLLLWFLWPTIARGHFLHWSDSRRFKVVACLLLSLAPVMLVFAIATFPGEWLDNHLPNLRFPAPWKKAPPNSWQVAPTTRTSSLHELLVGGEVDTVRQRPMSLWSNRLVLPEMDVIDHVKFDTEAKIAALPTTISLRGRHLEGAVLPRAQLRKADFTGAVLKGAVLEGADLREAKFDCAPVGPDDGCADLRGAVLNGAKLQGASLAGVNGEGAQLQRAILKGAHLGGADLRGADLDSAIMPGAGLFQVDLAGANLMFAQLQGAYLLAAHLEGANLEAAHLEGAELEGASLIGAMLDTAEMLGADLQGADLSAADLDRAQLQGANLQNATLQAASLRNAFTWRVGARNADLAGAYIGVEDGAKYWGDTCPKACAWTAKHYDALTDFLRKELPANTESGDAQHQRGVFLPDAANKSPDVPRDMATRMKMLDPRITVAIPVDDALKPATPAQDQYEANLAQKLKDAACGSNGSPEVIANYMHYLIGWNYNNMGVDVRITGKAQKDLVNSFLDPEKCPTAARLTVSLRDYLKRIAGEP